MTEPQIPTGKHAAHLLSRNLPPQAWFGISAIFHYFGPSCAVLLFPTVGVLGIAWLRIATAAFVFAGMTRPWRLFRRVSRGEIWLLVGLGTCLALMNCSFYLALARLPISLVATIEFVGTIGLALYGARNKRNLLALFLAVIGVGLLIDIGSLHSSGLDLIGLGWAVANAVFFMLYIILGHRIAAGGAGSGIERLGAAMSIAFVIICPIGLSQAVRVFDQPLLMLAGIGVGICSSVIPYICDQIVLARLPRASFALLLTLLPACAALVGILVLRQIPSLQDLGGIALVMTGVALHQPARNA